MIKRLILNRHKKLIKLYGAVFTLRVFNIKCQIIRLKIYNVIRLLIIKLNKFIANLLRSGIFMLNMECNSCAVRVPGRTHAIEKKERENREKEKRTNVRN